MSFSDLVKNMSSICVKTLGGAVTHTTARNQATQVQAITETGIAPDETDNGVNARLFARADAFTNAPEKGDRITISSVVYVIFEIEADGLGGLDIKLRKL